MCAYYVKAVKDLCLKVALNSQAEPVAVKLFLYEQIKFVYVAAGIEAESPYQIMESLCNIKGNTLLSLMYSCES